MAYFLAVVIQIVSLLVTTRLTYAAQNPDETQQPPHLRSSGQPSSPPVGTPAQEAHPLQLPDEGPSVTPADTPLHGEQISRANAAPSDPVATEGDRSHVESGGDVSQVPVASEQGTAAPASVSVFPKSEMPGVSSTSTEEATFQCITHTGEALRLRFHRIVLRTTHRVYMDMERVESGQHELFYGIFCPETPSGVGGEASQAYEMKRAAFADMKWQKSLFPEEMSSDLLFKKYRLVVPDYYCGLPSSAEVLELGDAGKSLKLLNMFVSMPPAITPLQSVDISKLTADIVVQLCVEMTKRVAVMHRFGVLHRKISLRSFLVSQSLEASNGDQGPDGDQLFLSLGDFSSAQPATGQEQLYSRVASLKALAPSEARIAFSPLRHKLRMVVTKAHDAWGLGLAIYSVMCNGRTDPYRIFTPVASELVLLRRICKLTETPRQVNFNGCLPLTAHAGILWLRDLVVQLLDPHESTRLLPENALSNYPQLFGHS